MIIRMLDYKGTATDDFTDVNTDAWYAEAVSIATDKGIVSGVGNGEFNPNGAITREQAMVMAYNALVAKNVAGDSDNSLLSNFTDGSQVSSWAQNAVSALIKAGVISGSDGKLNPQANITRAEICVIINKLMTIYDL